MLDNPRAVIGGNNPPDPIDEINNKFEVEREEAENWADGFRVETDAQEKQVDALRKAMRDWRIALEKGQKEAVAPLTAAANAERDRWKPSIADAKSHEDCLIAAVDAYKRKRAEEREAEERRARAEAEAARRAAAEAAAKADAANLEERRAAAEAQREADEAQRRAVAASKAADTKGLRTVTRYEITDHRALLNWVARNRRDDVTAFIEDWARRNHKPDPGADGLRVWQDRVAY